MGSRFKEYAVFYINVKEIDPDIDTVESIPNFLRTYSDYIMRNVTNDQFNALDDADDFAKTSAKSLMNTDIIAICNARLKQWIKYYNVRERGE